MQPSVLPPVGQLSLAIPPYVGALWNWL